MSKALRKLPLGFTGQKKTVVDWPQPASPWASANPSANLSPVCWGCYRWRSLPGMRLGEKSSCRALAASLQKSAPAATLDLRTQTNFARIQNSPATPARRSTSRRRRWGKAWWQQIRVIFFELHSKYASANLEPQPGELQARYHGLQQLLSTCATISRR